jgi:D-arabinose 1-dehydrogenase-like Zn-dependent alcohol dehydrogenase
MPSTIPTTRRAFRRTDDVTPGAPKFNLVTEDLALPLKATQVLIKVHAVSLNYRDANIANGGNPWPVIPYGIPCNDAAGEVIAKGEQVSSLNIGDRVAPIIDTENLTGQESTRSWLAADEDGVLADYIVFDQRVVCKLPGYLDWTQASIIPCAGVTAWAAMKGFGIGKSVLIQGMCPTHNLTVNAKVSRNRRRKPLRPKTRPRSRAQSLPHVLQRPQTPGHPRTVP